MKLSLTAKRMFIVIGACALLFTVIAAFVYRSQEIFWFVLGVIPMSALSCAKVVMLEQAVEQAAQIEDAASAKNYIKLRYFLRLGLTVAVLIGAGLSGHSSMLWGAIAGVFTFQGAALSLHFFIKRDEAKNRANLLTANTADKYQDIDSTQS